MGNDITGSVIGAAIEVHRELGTGLLESTYEECLDCGYRSDVLVEDSVIIEMKAADALIPVHTAQVLTYLKLLDKSVGLLINFNVPGLRKGLKRAVNNFHVQPPRLSPSAVKLKPSPTTEPPCCNVF